MDPAASQVAALLGSDPRIARAGPVRILAGDYDFVELKQWRDGMNAEVLGLPGVILTDIDEVRNRLRVGVERADVVAAVEDRLARFGVPREAVLIEVTQPIRQLNHDLRDSIRPLAGGSQISFVGGGSIFFCTLGFPAVRNGRMGFVTNSHCSLEQGGKEGTIYHQPEQSGTANRIGREFRDPKYRSGGGCPAGVKCRWSDTTFVDAPHKSGPDVDLGHGIIARPRNQKGSLKIKHNRDEFRITSVASGNTLGPLAGGKVSKSGRTTGYSSGKVTGTCLNILVAGTNLGQFCQDQVDARVDSGDSGSPVFIVTNDPKRDDVTLVGILWGGSADKKTFGHA